MKQQYLMRTQNIIIMSLIITCCTFVTRSDDSSWTTTVLRQGRTFEITAGGLCSDNQGQLHLAYGESDLFYAVFDGSSWNLECVDNTPIGRSASIQVDTDGIPWICFIDCLTHTLKLARKDASGWDISIIDENVSESASPILKLDTGNKPHVGYVRAGSSEKLVYATLSGREWQYHQFEDRYQANKNLACHLVLNTRQEPYINCAKHGYYLLDNEWKSDFVNGNAFTTDQNRSIHWLQIYNDAEYGHLNLSGSRYTITHFDSASFNLIFNQDSTLILDDQNQPHAFYLKDGSVNHAVRTGLSWHIELVHSIPQISSVAVAVVRVGDTFHCVVVDHHNGTLLHLENSTGEWNSMIIDREVKFPRNQCFDMDSKEVCHVVYSDSINDTVYYMNNSEGIWATETLGVINNASTAPVSLKADDSVLIGLYDPGQEQLCIYQKSADGFIRMNLPGNFSEIYALNVVTASPGVYYYVYLSDQGWYIANNASGVWNTLEIDIPDPYSPALSSVDLIQSNDGRIFLGITDFQCDVIRYVYEVFEDVISIISAIDGCIYFQCTSPCSLAVDKWGFLHDFRINYLSYGKG